MTKKQKLPHCRSRLVSKVQVNLRESACMCVSGREQCARCVSVRWPGLAWISMLSGLDTALVPSRRQHSPRFGSYYADMSGSLTATAGSKSSSRRPKRNCSCRVCFGRRLQASCAPCAARLIACAAKRPAAALVNRMSGFAPALQRSRCWIWARQHRVALL